MWCTSAEDVWADSVFLSDSSVAAYYREISLGNLSLLPALENFGRENDGIAEVTLPYPHYEAMAQSGRYTEELGEIRTPEEAKEKAFSFLVSEALRASASLVDYDAMDLDRNGKLEVGECLILLVFPGYLSGREEKDAEVSDSYTTPSMAFSQSVQFSETFRIESGRDYNLALCGEWWDAGRITPPGVISHEICHLLGGRDLYDLEGRKTGWPQPYYLSLMHNTLAELPDGLDGRETEDSVLYPDPYHRILLGLCDSVTEVYGSGDYRLYSTASGKYNLLKIYTPDPDEYFLVEYRSGEGFESGLFPEEGGFLVWLIDEKSNRLLFDSGNSCSAGPFDPGIKPLAHGITDDGYTYRTYHLEEPLFREADPDDPWIFQASDFSSPLEPHASPLNRFPSDYAQAEYSLTILPLTETEDGMEIRVEMPVLQKVTLYAEGKPVRTLPVLRGDTLSALEPYDDTPGASWRLYAPGAPTFDPDKEISSDISLIWSAGESETSSFTLPTEISALLILLIFLLLCGISALRNTVRKKKLDGFSDKD
ncbi:MAG: hypothetical protein II797_04115 [Clostridia bacterium]|nr:hypothetical protein [Clostridia bacterium]